MCARARTEALTSHSMETMNLSRLARANTSLRQDSVEAGG
jgi:hypothetical protein